MPHHARGGRAPRLESEPSLPQSPDSALSRDRRRFLGRTLAMGGGAIAGAAVGSAAAAALDVPPTNKAIGKPIAPADYGMPSAFEKHVARRRTDVFVNRQNWSEWSM